MLSPNSGSAAREVVRGGGPGGERHVHEVGRTAHHAACGARPVQHHDAAGFEFFAGAGDDEGQSDAVAGSGRRVGHFVAEFRVALHVVERGDGARAARETWMRGHVLDAFTADPDLAFLFAAGRSDTGVRCEPAWCVSFAAIIRSTIGAGLSAG